MDVIHERCAGLDVHTLTVVACVVTPGPRGRPHKEVRTFGTTSEALLQLADWLRERGVGAAALEATGVYWRPVWNVLEAAGLDLLLANPQHVKHVPGRKTDVHLVSCLADSGFTLTVALNFADHTLVSIASNESQWFPAAGTFLEGRG